MQLSKNHLLLFSIWLAFSPMASSQGKTLPQSDNVLKTGLDSIVHQATLGYFNDSSKVGLSMAMLFPGEEHFYNYGSEEKGNARLPTRRTFYEIGSVTKTFCGMVLAQAVADKKVSLDDDIRHYLDEPYPNLEYQGAPISLYQLLNHSSGLPFDFIDRSAYETIEPDSLVRVLARVENQYSREQLYNDLHKVKLDTVPGFKLGYSNIAAQLLGYILEKVYEKPFSELVSEFITSPANMKRTTFRLPDKKKGRIAKGYNEKAMPMPHFNSGAAGGLFSTSEDLLKYGKLHLDENNPVIALTHKPTWGQIQYFAFGLNWQMQQKNATYRRIWQSGGTAGFTSLLVIYPELKLVMVFLSNEHDENSEGALSSIETGIFDYYISQKKIAQEIKRPE